MNITDEELKVNQNFQNILVSFVKQNRQTQLRNHNLNYTLEMTSPHFQTHGLNYQKLNQVIKCVEKTNLYFSQKDTEGFQAKKPLLQISPVLQREFFQHWLIHEKNQQELFKIAGRVISLPVRLDVLSHDIDLFKEQFTSRKKSMVKIPDNNAFQQSLDILNRTILNEDDKIGILRVFCENYPLLFKRIEAQSILQSWIQTHVSEDKQEKTLTQFKSSLKDISNETSFFDITYPVYFFQLDKKRLFIQTHHALLLNKMQLTEFMNHLLVFFKLPETRERCELKNIYLQDTEIEFSAYTWILHCANNTTGMNYQELFEYLIVQGTAQLDLNNRSQDWSQTFKVILNHYFLSKNLSDSKSVSEKKKNHKI